MGSPKCTPTGTKRRRPPTKGEAVAWCVETVIGLEEQHQADGRREGLVLVRRRLLVLRPGVVALAHDLEGLGGLVVDAAGDERVLGLERGLAVGGLQVARSEAAGERHLAVGRSHGDLADEAVRGPELTVVADAEAVDR